MGGWNAGYRRGVAAVGTWLGLRRAEPHAPNQSNDPALVEQVFEQAGSLHVQGRLDEAERLYRAILQADGNHLGALHNLGILCFQRGQYDETVALTRAVVRLRPDLAVAHNTLSTALSHLGRFEEAEICCREALRLQPDYAEAHNTLANVLMGQSRWQDAEACCREALRLQPGYAEAHNTLSAVLIYLGRHAEAEINCREALRLKPGNAVAFTNLGNALSYQEKLSEAMVCFERAAALNPNDNEAAANWFLTKLKVCDWSNYREHEARVRNGIRPQATPGAAFRLLGCSISAAEHLAFARRVAAGIAVPKSETLSAPPPSPRERLRLGYLSANFGAHPVAHLLAGVIEHHDRRRFEVLGYGFGKDDASTLRRRLTGAFDRFVDIADMDDREAARFIHADDVDVLIDLNGFTPDCRAKILAYRPAPIQVNYLGYPGTMGADFIDYIIADRFVVPPDQQAFFSERLVYLPECYQCNDDKRAIAERTPSRRECGLPEQGFVFCCFNDNYKITPSFFDIWMRLLRALPESVLWLYASNGLVKANLAREAEARGIAPERLVFASRVPQIEDHLARHRVADLFLDTLPYNAHTTASDALWAGLPVLTCAGDTFAGRVAGSLLHTIGLKELVTTALEDYEALPLRLARDGALLASLRARLARNRHTYRLFDTARYTRHPEAAYWRMNELRRAGQTPTAFAVPPLAEMPIEPGRNGLG
jgi:protein O-GlcNAc transferase